MHALPLFVYQNCIYSCDESLFVILQIFNSIYNCVVKFIVLLKTLIS